MKQNEKTNRLTDYAISAIIAAGGFADRVNSGAVFDKNIGGYRKPKNGIGWPDVVGVIGSLFIGIEIKSKADKLRQAQFVKIKAMQAAGGRVLVARSIKDVDDWIKSGFPKCVPEDFLPVKRKTKKTDNYDF